MTAEPRKRGFAHHHTNEELEAYRRLSPEQKLRWLAEAWRLTVMLLPGSRREVHRRLRAGEL